MKKTLLFVLLTLMPVMVWASEEKSCGAIDCEPFHADIKNKESLQRGARTFMNYCMGCHTTEYMRYTHVAEHLGVPTEMFLKNLVLDGSKIGDLMQNGMTKAYSKKVFGAPPPDLTLVARARSPQWLYTYLRSFYADSSRPYGVNNLVFKDVGMPHVLLELQGMPECAEKNHEGHCEGVETKHTGAMKPEEFDRTIYDLVNYMTYIAEPMQEDRKHIGIYVLLFLAFFFVWTYLLNREYWKDVH